MILKKYKNYFEYLCILLFGVITSFSLPPNNLWFLNFITFSLLFVILHNNRVKSINFFFICGYIFGFGYFLSSLYWIPLSLLHDDNFSSLIPLAIILIPAFLSLFYALAFLVIKILFDSKSTFVNILIFSLVLSIFEYLRGTILSGFPWNLFAYSLSENVKIIQINSLIGIYAFNMTLITVFCAPSILILYKQKKDILGLLLIIFLSASSLIYGNLRINDFKKLEVQNLPFAIKILSTNISIERFYSSTEDDKILIKLIDLSNPIDTTNSIFIWPEGVIPNISLDSLKKEYDYLFKKSFSKNHKIILGINYDEIKNEKKSFYNSLSVIDNEANVEHRYYKNKLVPFGEFLPLENFLSKIGMKSLTNNYQSYTPSNERKLFSLDQNKSIKFLPLICYEIIYSGQISFDNDFDFIINISEDGWFGNSIGPYQHFAHSIFRSVEYGKYTLRSTNNGISAIIDPTGKIVDHISIDNEGVISIKEIVNVDKTLFSAYGNKIYFLTILLYIFLIFSFKKIKK